MSTVPQLMESFSLFTPSGSTITFVLPEEAPPTWPSRLGNCRFNFTTAGDNPTGVKVRDVQRLWEEHDHFTAPCTSCRVHCKSAARCWAACKLVVCCLCPVLVRAVRCCWMPASKLQTQWCWAVDLL
jgi:hypothetical protein